jgi:hypothetical protein
MKSAPGRCCGPLAAILLSLVATPLFAVPIPYDGIVGTTIDFDSLTASTLIGDGELVTDQFAGLGIHFSTPNYGAYATTGALASPPSNSDPNVVWVDQGGGSGANAVGLEATFDAPVQQVGVRFHLSLGSTATIEAYSGATLIDAFTTPLGSGEVFGSLLTTTIALSSPNISRVVFSSANASGENWNFSIDDLRFSAVPEPSAMILLVAGLTVGPSPRRRLA